jgi:hypothetical protein
MSTGKLISYDRVSDNSESYTDFLEFSSARVIAAELDAVEITRFHGFVPRSTCETSVDIYVTENREKAKWSSFSSILGNICSSPLGQKPLHTYLYFHRKSRCNWGLINLHVYSPEYLC